MGARSLVEVHAAAARDPEAFWAEAASAIAWSKPWRRVLETSSAPFYRWFDGAELNTGFASAARNIPNIDVLPIQGINVYDILRRQKLVLTKAAVDALEARFK